MLNTLLFVTCIALQLGSVTNDVSAAVKAAKSGRVDFKIDKTAIVHVGLGKVCKSSINPIVLVVVSM